eukprot:7998455-Lingulodinium_polyedra.AAC.1
MLLRVELRMALRAALHTLLCVPPRIVPYTVLYMAPRVVQHTVPQRAPRGVRWYCVALRADT